MSEISRTIMSGEEKANSKQCVIVTSSSLACVTRQHDEAGWHPPWLGIAGSGLARAPLLPVQQAGKASQTDFVLDAGWAACAAQTPAGSVSGFWCNGDMLVRVSCTLRSLSREWISSVLFCID